MFAFAKYFDDRQGQTEADRDAALRHYIQLHPDDFPPFERKKLKDVLENWAPLRN